MSKARIIGPSEGRVLDVLGDRILVKTHGSETEGRFSLTEFNSPKAGGPPPHRHAWREGYWVVDGEIALTVDGKTATLSPGSWMVVPGGAVHSLKTLSDGARYLMFSEPAGVEDFLAEVHAEADGDPPDLEKIIQIAGKHGIEAVLG
jgi:quercetin dioxygenase-like cupin family protein